MSSRSCSQLERSNICYPNPPVTAADFRRIALSFDGAEQGSHMGATDFRVGGHIFATLLR